MATGPVAFMVLRSSGHSGSAWLSELLATQNLTFLFEFGGRCGERYPTMANASLMELFAAGCDCRLDQEMAGVCQQDEEGRFLGMSCTKHALCSASCPRRRSSMGCRGVGMLNSYQPGFAHRLLEERRRGASFAVVTFERDNAIKHAISKLRTNCHGSYLKGNHAKRSAVEAGTRTPDATAAFLYVEPALLRAEAMEAARGRMLMGRGVGPLASAEGGGVQYELHYEELQRAPSRKLRELLRAVGVHAFNESALGRSAMVKGTSDALGSFLLNYDQVHEDFSDQPCLQRMLGAVGSVSFSRDCVNITGAGKHHQAKQDAHARVLRCSGGDGCEVVGMNRLALKAPKVVRPPKASCTEEERQLCAKASATGLRSKGGADVELCTLRVPPSDDIETGAGTHGTQ